MKKDNDQRMARWFSGKALNQKQKNNHKEGRGGERRETTERTNSRGKWFPRFPGGKR